MKTRGLFFSAQTSFAILATFFALWLAVFFDSVTEDYMGYILIITIGVLHGTNDIRLIRQGSAPNGMRLKPLLAYVILVLVTGSSFLFVPALALLLFVLMSCYHFGEQHWVTRTAQIKISHRIFYMFYGMLIFSLLFLLNSQETINVIQNITLIELKREIFLYTAISSSVICLLLAITFRIKKTISTNWVEELFLIALFSMVFSIASLIWAFAIYFILWHSIPSLYDQIRMLYGKSNKLNLKLYLRSSWIYYLVSVVGLGLFLFLLKDEQQLFLSAFF